MSSGWLAEIDKASTRDEFGPFRIHTRQAPIGIWNSGFSKIAKGYMKSIPAEVQR